jgi:hypothetical protein
MLLPFSDGEDSEDLEECSIEDDSSTASRWRGGRRIPRVGFDPWGPNPTSSCWNSRVWDRLEVL